MEEFILRRIAHDMANGPTDIANKPTIYSSIWQVKDSLERIGEGYAKILLAAQTGTMDYEKAERIAESATIGILSARSILSSVQSMVEKAVSSINSGSA